VTVERAPAVPLTVIGLGNDLRGDDGVGLYVARGLRRRVPPGVRVVEAASDPLLLLEVWRGTEHAIVVDAMRSGAPPGTIARLAIADGADATLVASTRSSHSFGLAEAVALAGALGRLPSHLVIFGVESAAFEHGAPMSPAVRRAADLLVERIGAEIDAMPGVPAPPHTRPDPVAGE
jgi:hydrogenase maturation protease